MVMAVIKLFKANTSACKAKCQHVSLRANNRPLRTAAEGEEERRWLVQVMTAAADEVKKALNRFIRHATPKNGIRREASLYAMQNKG